MLLIEVTGTCRLHETTPLSPSCQTSAASPTYGEAVQSNGQSVGVRFNRELPPDDPLLAAG